MMLYSHMIMKKDLDVVKTGVHENAFIAKMGSCENALLLRKEYYFIFKNKQFLFLHT